MGSCCSGNARGSEAVISLNSNKYNMNDEEDNTSKQNLKNKLSQSDDCSVLISTHCNELNYNVKYRESNVVFPSNKPKEENQ